MISFETDVSALAGSTIGVGYDLNNPNPADVWTFPTFANPYSVSAFEIASNLLAWFNDPARTWSGLWMTGTKANLVAAPAEDGGISFVLNTTDLDESTLWGIRSDQITPSLQTFLGWTSNYSGYAWNVDSRDLEPEYNNREHWAVRSDTYPMVRWSRSAGPGPYYRYWTLFGGVMENAPSFYFPTGAIGTAYCDLFRIENFTRWSVEQGVSARNGSWSTSAQVSALRRPLVEGVYTELQARAVTVAASVAANPRRAYAYQNDANAWRYLAIADIDRDREGPQHYAISFKAVG